MTTASRYRDKAHDAEGGASTRTSGWRSRAGSPIGLDARQAPDRRRSRRTWATASGPASSTRTRPARSRTGSMCPTTCSAAGASARSAATMGGYNPISYHCGSVWPHDNAIAAAGLMRYGFVEEAPPVDHGDDLDAGDAARAAACPSCSPGSTVTSSRGRRLPDVVLAAGVGGGVAAAVPAHAAALRPLGPLRQVVAVRRRCPRRSASCGSSASPSPAAASPSRSQRQRQGRRPPPRPRAHHLPPRPLTAVGYLVRVRRGPRRCARRGRGPGRRATGAAPKSMGLATARWAGSPAARGHVDEGAGGDRLRVGDDLGRRSAPAPTTRRAASKRSVHSSRGSVAKIASSTAISRARSCAGRGRSAKRSSASQLGRSPRAFDQHRPVPLGLDAEQPEPPAVARLVGVDHRVHRLGARQRRRRSCRTAAGCRGPSRSQ